MIIKVLRSMGVSDNPIMKLVTRVMRWPVRSAQFQLLTFHKEKQVVQLIRSIQKDGDSLMWPTEMAQLYCCVSAVKHLPGDFAEVGVYAGRSARLFCEVKGNKTLHLFDTFEGLPEPSPLDDSSMRTQMYTATLESVKAYLSAYANVRFYPGLFPGTAEAANNVSFSFVHLDVDLHRSTLDCLKFFYPKICKGGIIVSHDYSRLAGVKTAFDEFFADKNETVVELSTSQCLVVKG